MKPREFVPSAESVFRQSSGVANVSRAPQADPPYVSIVELASGAQIHVQWVSGAPPTGSAPIGEPDPIVTGPPPAPVKVPELPTSGRLRTGDVEAHLAALLINAGSDQVADVAGYSTDPQLGSDVQPYGIRVRFHDGGAVYGLFRHTLPRGAALVQGGEFKQREEV